MDENHDGEVSSSGLNRWTISIGAVIALVLVVNGYMAYLAFTGGPGLVVPDYYERGKSYSSRTHTRYLSKKKKVPEAVVTITDAGDGEMRHVTLTAKEGDTFPSGEAVLFLYRPSDAKKDFSIQMVKTDDGGYGATLRFPAKGYWDLIIEIPSADKTGESLKYAQRIEVTE